jgi:L-aspartate oxidase
LSQLFDVRHERALLPVDLRRIPLYRFAMVVVGGGAAGCSAALSAAERGCEVALLAKADLVESNTLYAQGGMAAACGLEDSFESHVADTLKVGCGLSEPATVERVIRSGPAAVERLLNIGARFDRNVQGELLLSREGGHSHARIVHARGDATGREIQMTVVNAVRRHVRIATFENTFVIDALKDRSGRVVGVLAVNPEGKLVAFSGSHVLLATGGAGQLYRETSNPAIATGDGVAIGFRGGAAVRDLEFFQFHPTLLYIAGAARVLISEIVRGAGGVLRDRHGVRFMPEYHDDADLAPRDVVSRAVFDRMVDTGDTNVYLDLSHVRGDPHVLFPGISTICRFFGIDIARDPVPVRPGAHYMVGGLEVDADGRSTVPGLWAVGECASSGLHGANRMGSNSLLEALVLGTRAGEKAAAEERSDLAPDFADAPQRERATPPQGIQVNVQDVTYSLKSLMWRQLGVKRSRSLMEDALIKIALWTRAVTELGPPDPIVFELVNMLTVAHLTAVGAFVREESRGVHYRSDFPVASSAWGAHSRLEPVCEGSRIHAVRASRVPVDVQPESGASDLPPARANVATA